MKETFRPTTARIVSYASAASMVTLFIAMYLAFPPDIREQFTPDQILTLVLGLFIIVVILHGIGRSKVVATEETITIVNGYRTYRIAWSDVVRIGYRGGAPWPTLIDRAGNRRMMFAIQSADGAGSKRAVEILSDRIG